MSLVLPSCGGLGYTAGMTETSKSQRRLLRLTPDRLLLALVPVWGVLFLAEHYRWLPKGYPVLLAVVTLAAMLVLLLLWFAAALLFRGRFQFSIRSLLLLTVIVSVWGSWFAVEMRGARRQREAAESIEKLGGLVNYDWEVRGPIPPGPAWLRKLLGEEFANVVQVVLERTQVTDAGLEHLKGLTRLHDLSLGGAHVTDAGLENLKGLNQLQKLFLDSTQVTDAGLENLTKLSQLRFLILDNTQVTDAGLECLKGLTHLQTFATQQSPGDGRWSGTPEGVDSTPNVATQQSPRDGRWSGTPERAGSTPIAAAQQHPSDGRWPGTPESVD